MNFLEHEDFEVRQSAEEHLFAATKEEAQLFQAMADSAVFHDVQAEAYVFTERELENLDKKNATRRNMMKKLAVCAATDPAFGRFFLKKCRKRIITIEMRNVPSGGSGTVCTKIISLSGGLEMKRKMICAALATMLAVTALWGCGEKKESSTTAAQTTAAATEAQAELTGLAAKARVTYNGVTFGTGDKASEVVAGLGDQLRPAENSQPCIPGAGELTNYYFDGLTITASQFDVISRVSLNNDYGQGQSAKIAGSVGIGSGAEETRAALGTPATEDEYGLSYQEGELNITVILSDDAKVMVINIEDMSIEL